VVAWDVRIFVKGGREGGAVWIHGGGDEWGGDVEVGCSCWCGAEVAGVSRGSIRVSIRCLTQKGSCFQARQSQFASVNELLPELKICVVVKRAESNLHGRALMVVPLAHHSRRSAVAVLPGTELLSRQQIVNEPNHAIAQVTSISAYSTAS
jgi:hypothetical protein